MRRSSARRCALILACGGLAGCFSDRPPTGPEGPSTGTPAVEIENFAFVPPNLRVAAGATVTWTNHDDVDHTVSADDGTTFESGAVGPGETFAFTASQPGTHTYFCRIHPFMRATLTVTP